MARKNLTSQALMKKNTLLNAVGQATQFQKEITDETNVRDLPDNVREKVIYLPDDMLIDDPYNQEIYGQLEVEQLSQSMQAYGFIGIILAYPHGGKYRIESGHRRRDAARLAGLKEYPVLVTEAPKTEWERRMRLFLSNLHGRKEKPMVLAKVAQGLYEAHEMEIRDKKKRGVLKEGEVTALNELTAMDMELDKKTVEKYRQLLKLIPELQEMADSEQYSWSALTNASTLDERRQKELADMISARTRELGADQVKREWIVKICSQLKLGQNAEAIDAAKQAPEKKPGTRIRRKNGTKIIMSCSKSLHEVLDRDAIIKAEEVPAVIKTLEDLQKSIQAKLEELENKK